MQHFKRLYKAKQCVDELLKNAASIFAERSESYGYNYHHFGNVCTALFPEGIQLKTADDFNRFGLLVQKISKLTRYVEAFRKGGHDDSLADDAVYSNMLREIDNSIRESKGEK